MKRITLTKIIAALFILLFVYMASMQLFEFSTFMDVLSTSSLIGNKAPVVAWAMPFLEFGISLLLFASRTRRQGLWGSLGLMSLLTIYQINALVNNTDQPYGSGLLNELTSTPLLLLNILFLSLAVLGLWWERKRTTASNPLRKVIYMARA